jgi:hypothetical protein
MAPEETPADNYERPLTETERKAARKADKKSDKKSDKKAAKDRATRERQMGARRRR